MVCYAGLIDFEEAVVLDPAVRALAGKVRYVVDPDNPYPRQFTGHLRVTLRTGEVREASQGHFRGGREQPMSAEAPQAKVVAQFLLGGWVTPYARALRLPLVPPRRRHPRAITATRQTSS